MAFPKIAAHDAKTFTQRLFERVRKEDGGAYSVFDPVGSTSYVEAWKSVRAVRDAAAATDVFAHDLQGDLVRVADAHDTRLDRLETRVAALEAQPGTSFP